MQVKIMRTPGKKTWTPDRSRGKRFRTKPRSARGKWELVVDGKTKKKAAPKARAQVARGSISLATLKRMAKAGVKLAASTKKD